MRDKLTAERAGEFKDCCFQDSRGVF